jgi:hypothetical protein
MMRVHLLVAVAALTALVAAATPAVADTGGVIVHASNPWREPVRTAALDWLERKEIDVRADPLSSRDADALARCYQDDDEECAAPLAARAGLDQLVLITVTIVPGKSDAPTITVAGWQFGRDGRVVAFDVKHCEGCRTKSIATTTDTLLDSLERMSASLDQRGTLRIESTPPGARVLVDNFAAGVTPLTYKVRPGKHVISLELSGHDIEAREISVDAGQAADVSVVLRANGNGDRGGGRDAQRGVPGVWPWAVAGAGLVAVGAGIVLIAKDSPAEEDGRQHQTYWPTGTTGIAVTSVGVAAILTGAYFKFVHKTKPADESGTTVQVGAEGTLMMGYRGSF